jgi:O-antigen/teichoic acid export membrane protein
MLTVGLQALSAGLNRLRGRSRRDVLSLAAGTAGAQLLAVAFAPFITRLYGPDAFGIFGAYAAILVVVGPVSALAYPLGIVLPERDHEAVGLVKLSALISFGFASAVAIGLILASGATTRPNWLEETGNLHFFLPLALVAGAWLQIAQHWLTRKKAFTVLARRSIITAFATQGAKVLAGLAWPTALSLVVISLLGQLVGIVCLLIGISRSDRWSAAQADGTRDQLFTLWQIARRYRDLPLLRAPQMCLNAASQGLPVLMFMACGQPAAAGLYALAKSILAMPSSLLGQSVQQVFYPRCNEAALARQAVAPLIKRATVELAGIAFVPFLCVIMGAPAIFGAVFGEAWARSGQYAQFMAPWLFCALINRPSVAAVTVLRMQGLFLAYEIASVITRAVAIAYGFLVMRSDLAAVALFSLVGVVLNVLLIGVTLAAAGRRDALR